MKKVSRHVQVIRDSKTISVKLPAVVDDLLKTQRPWVAAGFASRNAWLVAFICKSLDEGKGTIRQRREYKKTRPTPRAGRV